MCQVFDKVPQTVILGIEPQDIETFSDELTPLIQGTIDPMIEMVLQELVRQGASYTKRNSDHVSGHTFKDCGN